MGSRRKEENKHMERSGLLAVQVQCSFSPDDFVALNCHLKKGVAWSKTISCCSYLTPILLAALPRLD